MQTEIEKRIEEAAIEFEKQAFLMAPYKETDLSDAFKAGAKFILEMPEMRSVLEFYAGNYMDGCKCSDERTCFLCRDYFFLKKAGLV